jgi:hypothetical protein
MGSKSRLTEILNVLEAEARDDRVGETQSLPKRVAPAGGYVFGQDRRYRIAVASDMATRRKAWNMVYGAYLRINYVNAHPSELRMVIQDASPATTTFLVEDAATDAALATFTLTPDSPLGLPLETYYAAEVGALRAAGRKPCEISKLVACSLATSDQPGLEVLLNAFKLAYLTARPLEACTDFVVAVIPRHVPYYRRLLMFEPLGEAKSYKSLNGLQTVPLRLDLLKAEERYRAKFGGLPGHRNLYRFFINEEEPATLDWLRQERRPMSAAEFRHFFMEQTGIYHEAAPEDRLYLQSCYLAYDLDSVFASAEAGT